MIGTDAVGGAGSAAPPDMQDGAQSPGSQAMQQAFAQGVAEYMATELQSMEGDIQQACNDTTSDPDAPS